MIRARKSKWSYDTAGGTSTSLGEVVSFAVANGSISLRSPQKVLWPLDFEAAGVSAGLGPIPVSTSDSNGLPSIGDIFMMESFAGPELHINDITGFCAIQDVTLAPGGSATAMFLGVEAKYLASELAIDGFGLSLFGQLVDRILDSQDLDWPSILKSNANAMLVMFGATLGGVGVSVTSSVGYVHKPGDIYSGVLEGVEKYRGEHPGS